MFQHVSTSLTPLLRGAVNQNFAGSLSSYSSSAIFAGVLRAPIINLELGPGQDVASQYLVSFHWAGTLEKWWDLLWDLLQDLLENLPF